MNAIAQRCADKKDPILGTICKVNIEEVCRATIERQVREELVGGTLSAQHKNLESTLDAPTQVQLEDAKEPIKKKESEESPSPKKGALVKKVVKVKKTENIKFARGRKGEADDGRAACANATEEQCRNNRQCERSDEDSEPREESSREARPFTHLPGGRHGGPLHQACA